MYACICVYVVCVGDRVRISCNALDVRAQCLRTEPIQLLSVVLSLHLDQIRVTPPSVHLRSTSSSSASND